MAKLIGTELAIDPTPGGRSRRVSWEEIERSDPDVTIVACCGFDTDRCETDANAASHRFAKLRCHASRDLYAANGDQHFARPSPKLLIGSVVMALCVYGNNENSDENNNDDELVRAIEALPFAAEALESYRSLDFSR